MEFISTLVVAWLTLALWMGLLWAYQYKRGEADIVDFGWTVCLGALAIYFALKGPGHWQGRLLAGLSGGLWSMRLGSHLLLHRVAMPGEDERYRTLRKHWGAQAQRNFFLFFQAQALLALLLAIPFIVIASNPEPPRLVQSIVALGLLCVSLAGETLADRQLQAFRRDPRNGGKTCRAGLWRYSRHPNYFFEWIYWLVYAALGLGASYGALTLVSPAIMLYLLLRVTGVPATEARALQSRGDDYREYQRTTSMFFPWFPLKDTKTSADQK